MNHGRMLPRSRGRSQPHDEHRDYSMLQSSIVASPPGPPPQSLLLPDEMDSLVREKLDLHSQLFEAAQIQRKLSGPRELRHGSLQFASEFFAARFLSGDF